MAREKQDASVAVPNNTPRPFNALYLIIFVIASAGAAWLMRIETVMKGIPFNFAEQVEARVYPNGVPMRTHYTGIEVVDSGLLFLVAAFAAGPLAWDEGVRLHQLHFLVQFFAVVAVWNVEACRARHAWRLVSFTGLFVLFYQTVAGAAIIPLYYLSYTWISRCDGYYGSGRAVSLPYARGLLFSVTLGYLVPTLAMYSPGISASTAEFLIFLWQPSPGFVNILLFTASLVFSGTTTATVSNKDEKFGVPSDVKHLKRVYAAAAVVCTINHLVTVYVCAVSTDPQLSFSYVFLPSRELMTTGTTAGLHYIFQVDWWGCFVPTLLWAWITVYDVHRLLLGKDSSAGVGVVPLVKWAVYILGLTVAIGPGGMLAIVWSWREDRLVMIEAGVRGTLQKPKSA